MRGKSTEPDSSQDKKKQVQIEIQEAFKHRKNLCHCKVGQTLEQIDQESCGVSIIGDNSELNCTRC